MISFNSTNKTFTLSTVDSTYAFRITDYGYLEHLYYGKRLDNTNGIQDVSDRQIYSFQGCLDESNRQFSPATLLQECSVLGNGDYRTTSIIVDGQYQFGYVSHRVLNYAVQLDGMPCCRPSDNAQTLEITLQNSCNVVIKLFYVVYGDSNVICRHTEITNNGTKAVAVNKCASCQVDLFGSNYDAITLQGTYLAERSDIVRAKLHKGIYTSKSLVGISGHFNNPFVAIADVNATENEGSCYGFNLVYSGNFCNSMEVDRLGNTRVLCGIDDTAFCWKLNKGQSFVSPQCVITYSDSGLGGVSRNMHQHILNHVVDSRFAYARRPIVVNTWEPFLFDVDQDKVLRLADKCKQIGADTVVLDDGWFRPSDKQGLGEWKVDGKRFVGGIKALADKVHEMGLKFGIWIEPEMVNKVTNDKLSLPILSCQQVPLVGRNQYVIDLISDNTVNSVANTIINSLQGADIDYIKWDYNRYPLDISVANDNFGNVMHKQVLGSYKLWSKVTKAFPHTIFESCSGGGGRFDLGMLYYSPQVWTSDNTDPYARIAIQYGTSIAYPTSSISCHVSEGVCTSGRDSTLDFRYNVASMGTYGYELDVTKCSDDVLAQLNEFSARYRDTEQFVLNGQLYRLADYTTGYCAYMYVLPDKSKAQLTFYEINATGLCESLLLKLAGLDENCNYLIAETGKIISGGVLNNVGIRIGNLYREIRNKGLRLTFVKQ